MLTTDLQVRWTKRYGTDSHDQAYDIKNNPTNDALVLVTQMKQSGDWFPLIIYINTNGEVIWKKSIEGSSNDRIIKADFTRDGNHLFLMGRFESQEYKPNNLPAANEPYITFIKFNLRNSLVKSMDRILAQRNSFDGNFAKSFMIDQRNNIVITGYFITSTTP